MITKSGVAFGINTGNLLENILTFQLFKDTGMVKFEPAKTARTREDGFINEPLNPENGAQLWGSFGKLMDFSIQTIQHTYTQGVPMAKFLMALTKYMMSKTGVANPSAICVKPTTFKPAAKL